ncbi:MAG: SufD family Fe-S cluster assembly protein [Fusicatenibacter saccharivorans]
MDAAEKIFRGTIDFVRGSADSVGAETEQVLLLGDDVVNKTIPGDPLCRGKRTGKPRRGNRRTR